MGVKDLWTILSPLCERKPLFELHGKTIAIDMSCWVVDSQTITDHSAQPKMYLRNLFFRTAFLLMHGIFPVFVLEGKAPPLKHNTIAKRNDLRSGFRERKTIKKGTRSHFNKILKECSEMLQLMGLACVQGYGEAEAMCAYLNQDEVVDGCISQDSDCFLYGAKVVYRNFCTSAQGNRGGTNGAVDEYSLEKIENILDLGRNKMIALALLCGCDYNDGISGVGKEAALKLFKLTKEEDILDRIKNWKKDDSLDRKEKELLNPNLCSSCGHKGNIQKHVKSGCMDCGTITKCHDFYREKRALLLNEIGLRKKALAVGDFPNQELIDEFLTRKDPVPTKVDIEWKQPQLNEFIVFMERHLSWDAQYAFEKVFPLATRWQLNHLPIITIENRLTIPNLFIPDIIKKVRNIKSVASYEILWKSDHDTVKKLREYIAIGKENDENDDENQILAELTSIEPQEAIQKCYPELIEAFEEARNAKKKKQRRVKNVVEGVEASAKPKPHKRQQRKKEKVLLNMENNRKMDEFVSKNNLASLEESFERLSITPKRSKLPDPRKDREPNSKVKRCPQIDRLLKLPNRGLNNTLDGMFDELSPDDFNSDGDDCNMSQIIDDICNQRIMQFNTTTRETQKAVNEKKEENIENFGVIDVQTQPNSCDNKEIWEKSVDEFADICEFYIPLNQRILINK